MAHLPSSAVALSTAVEKSCYSCTRCLIAHQRKDVIELERMQKRFTRMLTELESLSYSERLDTRDCFH